MPPSATLAAKVTARNVHVFHTTSRTYFMFVILDLDLIARKKKRGKLSKASAPGAREPNVLLKRTAMSHTVGKTTRLKTVSAPQAGRV
jgi:hypothetical protein